MNTELGKRTEKIVESSDIYKDKYSVCENLSQISEKDIEYVYECDDKGEKCKIVATLLRQGEQEMRFKGFQTANDLIKKLEKVCKCGCSLKKMQL